VNEIREGCGMRIVLTALLSILLLLECIACTSKEDAKFNNIQRVYDDFLLDTISEIKVVNGTTGDRFTITDKEQIKEIFDPFSKLSIKDTEQPKEVADGYTYGITFYNGDEEVIGISYGAVVTDQLLINRHLYIVEDGSVIQSAIEYFDVYFDEHEEE
jgi:hypothetical protein